MVFSFPIGECGYDKSHDSTRDCGQDVPPVEDAPDHKGGEGIEPDGQSGHEAQKRRMIQSLQPFKQHIDPDPAERNPQTRTDAGSTDDANGQQGKREHVDKRRK